jgi:hypothetical protein
MPKGATAPGNTLPPLPPGTGFGAVLGAVPINGLTYCTTSMFGGVTVPPPEPPALVVLPPLPTVLVVLPPAPASLVVLPPAPALAGLSPEPQPTEARAKEKPAPESARPIKPARFNSELVVMYFLSQQEQ